MIQMQQTLVFELIVQVFSFSFLTIECKITLVVLLQQQAMKIMHFYFLEILKV